MKTMSLTVLATLALASAGCSAIVGNGCEQGYAPCAGRCVSVADDPSNCGGCGVVCAPSVACRAGVCADGMVSDAAWWPGDAGPSVGDGGSSLDGGDAGVATRDADADAAGDDGATELDGAFDPDASQTPDAEIDGGAATDGGVADDGGDLDAAGFDAAGFDAAGLGDAGSDDAGSGGDATASDAASDDAATDPPACDVGESLCGETCVRLDSDPLNCGTCGTTCSAASVCSAGECQRVCDDGLTECGRSCVDLTSSPTDCGGCGIVCATGICESSMCVAGYAGHVVVLGHDYAASRAVMDQLLSNALGLTAAARPRVLHYVGSASAASIAGVAAAMTRGRAVDSSFVADPSEVPAALASTDVLLVYPQLGLGEAALDDLGAAWSRALSTFLASGHAVVVLDTIGPIDDGGASRWLAAAGLAEVTMRQDVSRGIVRVLAPSDALVVGLTLSYRAEPTSIGWLGSSLPVIIGTGDVAVVMHRTVLP